MTESHDTGSGEDRLIARHFAPLAREPGAFGLRDDAATLTPPAGHDLVVTVDTIVAGMHFLPDDPPEAIARKALRINLSDLAAKGAEPLGFLLALAIPASIGDDWLAAFARALGEDADAFACPLLGGDTVATRGPVTVSVTAFGAVPTGEIVRRMGARPGDSVVVTGTIGDAALGLLVAREGGLPGLDRAAAAALLDRYRLPRPRNAVAGLVRLHSSAAMDVSDGLVGDLAKLARVSGVAARIEAARVPLSDAARAAVAADPALLETVLTGGDDYEVLATVPPDRVEAYLAGTAAVGVSSSVIGEVIAPDAPLCVVLGPDGRPLTLTRSNFSHF